MYNSYTVRGGVQEYFPREVSLLSIDKGGKMSMKFMVVARLKVSTKTAKAASGHLQQPVGIKKISSG